jgi:hypothetical protein
MDNTSDNSFFIPKRVTPRKNQLFKMRCEDAVTSLGLNNNQFYEKSGIIRQKWYLWSWGLEPFPDYVKIKLMDLFGKPFRDLFLFGIPDFKQASELEVSHPSDKQNTSEISEKNLEDEDGWS